MVCRLVNTVATVRRPSGSTDAEMAVTKKTVEYKLTILPTESRNVNFVNVVLI